MVVQTGLAQKRSEVYVNRAGITVPRVPDALAFYTQTMGFREAVTATDPGALSAFLRERLANATDLSGVRIELAELTPESLQRKAVDSWK